MQLQLRVSFSHCRLRITVKKLCLIRSFLKFFFHDLDNFSYFLSSSALLESLSFLLKLQHFAMTFLSAVKIDHFLPFLHLDFPRFGGLIHIHPMGLIGTGAFTRTEFREGLSNYGT
jgi:hypothetical protein